MIKIVKHSNGAGKMIKIVINSLGSGDWIIVLDDKDELFSGHRISPIELSSILEQLGHETDLLEVTDEHIFDDFG